MRIALLAFVSLLFAFSCQAQVQCISSVSPASVTIPAEGGLSPDQITVVLTVPDGTNNCGIYAPAGLVPSCISYPNPCNAGIEVTQWTFGSGNNPTIAIQQVYAGANTSCSTLTSVFGAYGSFYVTATQPPPPSCKPPCNLSIVTSSFANATVNSAYLESLVAQGGAPPYTWLVSGLPVGLADSPQSNETDIIAGIPTKSGEATVEVQVTDSIGCKANATLSIQVAPPPLTIATQPPLPQALVGTEYRFCFSASPSTPSQGLYKWQVSFVSIPSSGFYYNSNYFSTTGCFDSVPEASGDFPFSVVVQDPNTGDVSPPAYFTVHVAASTVAKAADARLANIYWSLCLAESPSGTAPTSIGEGSQAIMDCALALIYAKRAADPPDSTFMTIPEPLAFPFVSSNTGWPQNVFSSFEALLTDEANVFGYAQAALLATERAQGAEAAGDMYWTTKQAQAAAEFDELMTQEMTQYQPLEAAFKLSCTGAGLPDVVFTPAEISLFTGALPNLPVSYVSGLTAAGLTPSDLAVLTRLLAATDLPAADVSMFTLEDQGALALSGEAPNLSPVAVVRVAIGAPGIAAGIQLSLAAKLNNAEAAIGRGNFDAACGMLSGLADETNAQRGIGIPLAQDDAILAALATTNAFCPGGH